MKKSEIIKLVSDITNYKEIYVKEIIDTFFIVIKNKLLKGEKIKLFEFGNFFIVKTKNITKWSPITNTNIFIKSRNVLKFKISNKFKKELKDNTNE